MMKNCLVDFDGTLIDSSKCWEKAYILFCQNNSIGINNNIQKMFNNLPFEEWMHLIEVGHDIQNVKAKLFDYVKDCYIKCKPKHQVLKIINELKNLMTFNVITKEPIELVEYWLQFYGIDLFDEIKQVGEVRKNKEFYNNIYLLIDDNVKFCEAAKQNGIYVIGVNDYHTKEQKILMKKICDLYIE